MHKYMEIAQDIQKKILDGTYPIKSTLPNQKTLGDNYNVSRITIKKALDVLTERGLVYSIQGSGTYVKVNALVKDDMFDIRADQYDGLTKRLENTVGQQISSQILKFIIRNPNEMESTNLMIQKDDFIYEIIRLRLINEEEYIIEHTLMPTELVPGINKEILLESIYNYLIEELDFKIGGSTRRITAEKPDKYDMKHLDCTKEDPVLQVEQIVYLNDGTPFEYSKNRHRFDHGGVTVVDQYDLN